ncbi:hypothetical protein D3C86_2159950 [compost metagenome]
MMFNAMQTFYAFNTDNTCTRTANDSAHTIQIIGQVDNFRLLSRILDNGHAFS